jgi:hypothetical protein
MLHYKPIQAKVNTIMRRWLPNQTSAVCCCQPCTSTAWTLPGRHKYLPIAEEPEIFIFPLAAHPPDLGLFSGCGATVGDLMFRVKRSWEELMTPCLGSNQSSFKTSSGWVLALLFTATSPVLRRDFSACRSNQGCILAQAATTC